MSKKTKSMKEFSETIQGGPKSGGPVKNPGRTKSAEPEPKKLSVVVPDPPQKKK